MIEMVEARSRTEVMDLEVAISGMTITVGGGGASVNKVSESIVATEFVAESDAAGVLRVTGYLVQGDEDGSLTILVDEVGAEDEPYVFVPGGEFKLLARVFYVAVPIGATSLEDETITVWRIVQETDEVAMIARREASRMEPAPEQPESDPGPTEEQLQQGRDALKPNGGE